MTQAKVFSWRETTTEAYIFEVERQAIGFGALRDLRWYRAKEIACFSGNAGKHLLMKCVEELKQAGWLWVSPDEVLD